MGRYALVVIGEEISYSLRCSGSSNHDWTLIHQWRRVCPPHCFWFLCCQVTSCHRIHQSLSLVLGSSDKIKYLRNRNIHVFSSVSLSQSRPSLPKCLMMGGMPVWPFFADGSTVRSEEMSDQIQALLYCGNRSYQPIWILRLKQKDIKPQERWFFLAPFTGTCDPEPLDLRTMLIRGSEGGTREQLSFP